MSLLPLLDSFTLKRPITNASDSEGNPTTGYTTIGTYPGTYGSVTDRDQMVAGQRNQTVDAYVAVDFMDIRLGDRVTGLRGRDYDVVGVKDVRLHSRVQLRSTGP